MKLVINAAKGGFGLSQAAFHRLIELGIPVCRPEEYNLHEHEDCVIYDESLTSGTVISSDPNDAEHAERWLHTDYRFWDTGFHIVRHHPLLIQVVEELGPDASDTYAALKVVEIPNGVEYAVVDDGEGQESIHEVHRIWA